MAEALDGKIITQSNMTLAETLARALQGLRPALFPTIKLGRFMYHPRSGDWLDDFCIYARQMGVSGMTGQWCCSSAARSPWWLCKRGGVVPSTNHAAEHGVTHCPAAVTIRTSGNCPFIASRIPCTDAVRRRVLGGLHSRADDIA